MADENRVSPAEKKQTKEALFFNFMPLFSMNKLDSLTDSTIDGKLTNVEPDNVNTIGQNCSMA